MTFTFLQAVQADKNIGGYPIFTLGNELGLVHLGTTYSTGRELAAGIPLGNAYLADVRERKLFAAINVQANLGLAHNVVDWTDEPCKGDRFLWKNSTGGAFSNINCASIRHVTKYWVSPRGSFKDYLAKFREMQIDLPPTVLRVEFTRFADKGRRLRYQVDINPEFWGIPRDAEPVWSSNSWHKHFIQQDAKKSEFVARLAKWAEEVQGRMDRAFDGKPDAFSGLPDFSSYFKPTMQQATPEQPSARDSVATAVPSSSAAPRDPESVRPPYVETGDCWSYHILASGPEAKEPDRKMKQCATFVDRGRNIIFTLATYENGEERDQSYTLSWGAVTSVAKTVFTPPLDVLKFPLKVGDTYRLESTIHLPSGRVAGKASYEAKVVGWETVTVPAGTFRAIKVECRSTQSKLTYWYVPKVNRYVRYTRDNPTYHEVSEMTSYALNR